MSNRAARRAAAKPAMSAELSALSEVASDATFAHKNNQVRLAWQAALGLGLVAAIVLGFTHGLATSVLVLAATALLTAVWMIWRSLQVLAGDRSEMIEEALGVAAPAMEDEQKLSLIRALKDLEFERSLGKISEADYAELKARYRSQAKQVLRDIDQRAEPSRERAVQLATQYLAQHGLSWSSEAASPASEKAAAIDGQARSPATATSTADQPPAQRPACGSCGTANEPDAKFCKNCGRAFELAAQASPGAANQ